MTNVFVVLMIVASATLAISTVVRDARRIKRERQLLAALTGLMAWVDGGKLELGPPSSVWEPCVAAKAWAAR